MPLPTALRNPRLWLWFGPVLLWLLFCFFYTNTKGALSVAEIDAFALRMASAGALPDRIERLRRFMSEDDGDQFLMVNLLHMATDQGADENMDRYMAHMLPAMLRRGSHPALVGNTVHTAMDLAGIEGAEQWTSVGIVRYRSRRDLLEIALDPVFSDKHDFKLAALAKTIAVPVEPGLYLSDLRLLLLLALLSLTGIANAAWRRRGVAG